ncbi:Endonuclease YncB [Parelusimicrobium proximum]|uniref:thermonuclease family protein n=1 Tax=Parelusimicrobium proximum TaxID=3228953 RepID=UPI003D16941C
MVRKKKAYTNKKINKQISKIITLVLALIIAALTTQLTALNKKYQPVKGRISGSVIKISDGDTLTLLSEGREEIKVRLYGIDAPETGQDYGTASKNYLSSLIAGRYVEADIIDIDQYGRSVGVVFADEEAVNAKMAAEGYAWVYTNYCKIKSCEEWQDLQDTAKENRKGLWRQNKQTPPWKWRKNNK